MKRTEKLAAIGASHDHANPREGTRLLLGTVAARLAITGVEMAECLQVSRRTMGRIFTNEWPAQCDRAAMQQQLAVLFERRGASPEELARLFHAHGSISMTLMPQTDNVGRPVGYVAAPAQPQPEEDDAMLPRQTLTPQARKHFKLFTNPFEGDVKSAEQMFLGDDFAFVREMAWQCVQNGGFVAICGESGAGKTTVLADLEERMRVEAPDVVVIRPSVLGMEANDRAGKTLKSADILHAICHELDPLRAVPQTLQARTVLARKLLSAGTAVGKRFVLLVEEAHAMPDATLTHLKRLHELREGRRGLLGILLLGQPELKTRLQVGLQTGRLREVAQRCEVVELLPLDDSLKAYLEQRAKGAGQKLEALLDERAVDELRNRLVRRRDGQAVSMCYPLAVNNWVTLALNRCAALALPKVTADLIKAI